MTLPPETRFWRQTAVMVMSRPVGVKAGQTERVALETDMRFMDVAGRYPDSDTLFLHCLLSPYSTESGTAILDTATGEYAMLQKEWYAPYYGQSGPEFLWFNNQDMGYDVLYPVVGAAVVGEYAAGLRGGKGPGGGQVAADELPCAVLPVEQRGSTVGKGLRLKIPAALQLAGGGLTVLGDVYYAKMGDVFLIIRPADQRLSAAAGDHGGE